MQTDTGSPDAVFPCPSDGVGRAHCQNRFGPFESGLPKQCWICTSGRKRRLPHLTGLGVTPGKKQIGTLFPMRLESAGSFRASDMSTWLQPRLPVRTCQSNNLSGSGAWDKSQPVAFMVSIQHNLQLSPSRYPPNSPQKRNPNSKPKDFPLGHSGHPGMAS